MSVTRNVRGGSFSVLLCVSLIGHSLTVADPGRHGAGATSAPRCALSLSVAPRKELYVRPNCQSHRDSGGKEESDLLFSWSRHSDQCLLPVRERRSPGGFRVFEAMFQGVPGSQKAFTAVCTSTQVFEIVM